MRHSQSLLLALATAGGLVVATTPFTAAAASDIRSGGLSFIEPLATPLTFRDDPQGPQSPYGVASGDFNGDGKTDLAVTASENVPTGREDGYVYVMLGLGDGRFDPPSKLLVPRGPGDAASYAYGILVKDFDRDTKLDVVAVSPLLQEVLFFKGKGDGTFADPTPSPVDAAENIQTDDLDGDGILDLVAASRLDQTISVLIGKGDGTFQLQAVHPLGLDPQDIAIANFDTDPMPDIVVATYSCCDANRIQLLLNDGHGGFPGPPIEVSTFKSYLYGIFAADFDGDRKTDLLVAGSGNIFGGPAGGLEFRKGNGDGTFMLTAEFSEGPSVSKRQYSENTVHDIDGDGNLDVVFASFDYNYVTVLLGDGSGKFAATHLVASPGPGFDVAGPAAVDCGDPQSLVVDDFSGDGVPDVAIATAKKNCVRPGGVSVLRGAGRGSFRAPRSYSFPGAMINYRSTALRDFTNDHKPDLLSITIANQLAVIPGRDDGTLLATPTTASGGPCTEALTVADFDKDGSLDVACAHSTPTFASVSFGAGDGTFSAVPLFAPPEVPGFSVAQNTVVADFNGDTYPDVSVLGDSGRIVTYLYDPATPRTFIRQSPSIDVGAIDGLPIRGLGAADFDHDDHIDLVFRSGISVSGGPPDERFMVFRGNGDGTFQPPLITQPGLTTVLELKPFDFNHDGNPDLLAVTPTGFSILLGNRDATFAPPVAYAHTANVSTGAEIVDVDGDGNEDVVEGSGFAPFPSALSIFKGHGDGRFDTRRRFATGRDGNPTVDVGDVNGDGKPDIVAGVGFGGGAIDNFTVLLNDPDLPDLAVESADTPANAAPGDVITIAYTVRNASLNLAAGDWDDAVFLSTDDTLDAHDLLIGTVRHTNGVGAGRSYTEHLTAPLPGALPGTYSIIVRADASGQLGEDDESNNAGAAAHLVVDDVPVLANGVPFNGGIREGQFRYFRYAVQFGIDLTFRVHLSVANQVEFADRLGHPPSGTEFDQKYGTPADLQQELRTTPAALASYYVLLTGSSAAGAGASFTIIAEEVVPTVTPTATATSSPTPTATAVPTATQRIGDCDSSGCVSREDLVGMVRVALGRAAAGTCVAGDANHDGRVTIDEIVRAVGAAVSNGACGAAFAEHRRPTTPFASAPR